MIDTHAHLDLMNYKAIENAKKNGIEKMIIPAITNEMEKIIKIVNSSENIFFSVGTHPNHMEKFNLESLKKYINHKKCIAIGECGLDWYRIPKEAKLEEVKEKQRKVFQAQIELSIEAKKPLIIHSRETDDDMLEILLKYKENLIGGVIHCYVGSEKLLELEKYNFYYGIGGVLTYQTALELRENVKKIPLNKLLLETDSPFLTPRQERGKKNEPSFMIHVLNELSEMLNINKDELKIILRENTYKLFNI